MPPVNFLILALSALIPLVIGFIWYNPKVLGTAWMKASGMTEEKAKGANMPLVFGLTFIFSFFVAWAMQFVVIHEWGLFSYLLNDDFNAQTGAQYELYKDVVTRFPNQYRTFGHGAFHGFLVGLELALPIIGINSLFERKGAKYIFINVGYWAICFMLMGGVICQYS
ncbi:MAG: DUF1761 domain-containing protein [Flavobacteriales bacterium]